jgi:radical SAM superfamily enzyme YgiQ (UPF0313 family)
MKILLIAIDSFAYLPHFPLGIGYLASVLRNNNHEVFIYNQDIHHYPEEHLTRLLDRVKFDVVCCGGVAGYYPYKKILKISEAINKSKQRPKFILGGHMVSADPQYFLDKTGCDVIVKGEGEIAILEALTSNEKVIEKPLIQNLDTIPSPAYDLFPIEVYRLRRPPNCQPEDFSMSVITGRGCSFKCTFCMRLTPGIRLRSIPSIIEEIKFLKRNYRINYIDFEDDLTMTSKARMNELCEAILKNNLNIKWYCEGRLNFVDKEILNTMKSAGCVFINYGIESLDNEVLKNMNKALTKDIIIRGIELTKKVGISAGLNIMFGNMSDTLTTLRESVEFLLKYDDHSQIRTISPVQPYPGCELFNTAIKQGLLKDIADFYENKHVNSDLLSVNFTELSDQEIYRALYMANFELLNNYYKSKIYGVEKQLKELYINKNVLFRGWR